MREHRWRRGQAASIDARLEGTAGFQGWSPSSRLLVAGIGAHRGLAIRRSLSDESTILGYGNADSDPDKLRPVRREPTAQREADKFGTLPVVGFASPASGVPAIHQHAQHAPRLLALAQPSRVDAPAQPALALRGRPGGGSCLYRALLGATGVGCGLAALLYALDGAHAEPASYLADRNALIACCFGFFSILTFVRWRRHGDCDGIRWLSLLLLVLALSAGEMSLATVAYLLAYALILDRGTGFGRKSEALYHITECSAPGRWSIDSQTSAPMVPASIWTRSATHSASPRDSGSTPRSCLWGSGRRSPRK